tara:strand:+ start:184 stop:477 length:294 start_codon:yes stop_codon:yes gene_type:complete
MVYYNFHLILEPMLYPTKKSTVQVQSSTTNFKRRIEEEVVGVGRMDNNNYKEIKKKKKKGQKERKKERQKERKRERKTERKKGRKTGRKTGRKRERD